MYSLEYERHIRQKNKRETEKKGRRKRTRAKQRSTGLPTRSIDLLIILAITVLLCGCICFLDFFLLYCHSQLLFFSSIYIYFGFHHPTFITGNIDYGKRKIGFSYTIRRHSEYKTNERERARD
jgi:hypothetical protein